MIAEDGLRLDIPAVLGTRLGCLICGQVCVRGAIKCSTKRHRICPTCAKRYVQMQLEILEHSMDKFREFTKNAGRFKCVETACTGVIRSEDLTHALDLAELSQIVEWACKATNAKKVEDGDFLGMDGDGSLVFLFPNAVMCKHCYLGPFEPSGCEDMNTHQGMVTPGSTAPVNNSCPECGWFGAVRGQWLPWDGILRTRRDPETISSEDQVNGHHNPPASPPEVVLD